MKPAAQTLALIERGVRLPQPETVYVHGDVRPERIAAGVTIHPGCRLSGAATSIGPDCVLGREAPATVEDCRLGARVELKGGYFSGATFLDGASMGSGAHVRPGSLLEEESSGAHAVGLKQTILFPYVTLGSLINFCDVLMAGGTDRRNHSEVGSSYIHFNYTPHKDKATPSLVGDVPRGVRLDQPPVFLGGQGGLVGPCRIAFGTLVPAGTVYRHDVEEPGHLVFARFARAAASRPYETGAYGDVRRIVRNNLLYLGNLAALDDWYAHARAPFLARTAWGQACLEGAREALRAMLDERLKRMAELSAAMQGSLDRARRRNSGRSLDAEPYATQRRLAETWPETAAGVQALAARPPALHARDVAVRALAAAASGGVAYLDAVRALADADRQAATAWLQAIVDGVAALWKE